MNKEIRADVQRRSGLDKATCALLWNGLERVFREEVIHGVAIDLEGLGTFLPHKHPEYLQDDPATGQVMLYPPRITCRFRPAAAPAEAVTSSLQGPRLAALMGDYVKLPADEALRFLTALAAATTDRLAAGEAVTWTGFGTFRTVNFRDGESHRVAWVIDDKMRDGINAPFSCFEPVAVGQMEAPVESPVESPAEEGLEDVNPEAMPVEPPTEAEPIAPTEAEEPAPMEPTPENRPNPAPESSEIAPKGRKSVRKWIFGGIIFLFLIIICNICAPHHPTPEEEGTASLPLVAADTVAALSEDSVPDWDEADTVPDWDEEDSVPDWDEDLKVQPEALPEAESVSEATAVRATASAEMYLLDADGRQRTERVEPGDRLTLMARRLYGHKAFWVYIYEVNRDRLTSPDNVTAGMTLRLPDPAYWQIDSASEASVQTALRRAAKVAETH